MHMALMVLLSEQQGVMLATLNLSSRVGGFLIKARRARRAGPVDLTVAISSEHISHPFCKEFAAK